jgi:hypothetical protein
MEEGLKTLEAVNAFNVTNKSPICGNPHAANRAWLF